MALVLHEIKDSDFEYVVKVTTTSTNSAASVVDVSAAEGAATDPRLTLVAASWSVTSQTDILWDASSNIVILSVNGSGNYGHTHDMPAISNNAGGGITGDVLLTNGSASVGYLVLKFRKVSGWDNIT
ncbi:MAG: hypothetical protein MK200_08150 [Nitrosopumilus sp.]|nr:hypothetical protein [Nitrosopumilus sp.]